MLCSVLFYFHYVVFPFVSISCAFHHHTLTIDHTLLYVVCCMLFVVVCHYDSGQQLFLDHILRDNLRFHTAIIDEAAQASEPSTLIPLRYGCSRLVLVGDPRQLPGNDFPQPKKMLFFV